MIFEGNGWLIHDPLIFLYIWCKFPFLASVWLCSRQHKHGTTILDFGCETCGCVCVRVWKCGCVCVRKCGCVCVRVWKCGYAILCKWSFPNRKVTTWMPETLHFVSFAPPPSLTPAEAEKLWNSHLGTWLWCVQMVSLFMLTFAPHPPSVLPLPSLYPPPSTTAHWDCPRVSRTANDGD